MVFGLGTKDTAKAAKSDNKAKKSKKSDNAQADEAAAILKKMEDKKDDGECAFC